MKALFDTSFGADQDVSQLRRSLDIDRAKAADPLYKDLGLSIPPTQQMKDLMPRLQAVGALGEAKAIAAAKGIPWQENFFTTGPNKTYPTAESWDLVKTGSR